MMTAYFALVAIILSQNIFVHSASVAQDLTKCSTPGETIPAGDGCNTCTCDEDGELGMCTIELCLDDSSTRSEAPRICCRALNAFCLSSCADQTVEEYCEENPTTFGCPAVNRTCDNPGNDVPSPFDPCNTCSCSNESMIAGCTFKFCDKELTECERKKCGESCEEGICDGNGYCVNPEFNPCAVHGCDGKECGDDCLLGDIQGACNADGECDFDVESVILSGQCENSTQKDWDFCEKCCHGNVDEMCAVVRADCRKCPKPGQQVDEPCGVGVEQNKGKCRMDLECVFDDLALFGTCQVKGPNEDCSISHDEGFNETTNAICQGETMKDWNDEFDTQFGEENISSCKKFCNCKSECNGFTFNPNSQKRKCSWKADFPIEILTNEGIAKSGQSCIMKEDSTQEDWDFCEKCCHGNVDEMCAVIRADCRKCPNPESSHRCALPKQDEDCRLTGQNITYLDEKRNECRTHIFNGCANNGHESFEVNPFECRLGEREAEEKDCRPCEVHRDSENARLAESPFPILGYFVPDCNEDGHFNTKQRSGSSGYSFCYDKDGNKVESSDTPPGEELDCSKHLDEDGNRKQNEKQLGETCGACFNPNIGYDCGKCADGLVCQPGDPIVPDLPGTCVEKQDLIESKCKFVNGSDPSFERDECGEECGGNPFSEVTSFCEKDEKCCPSGPFGKECSTECGPYDTDELFGACESDSECCTIQDAPCNLECKKDQQCKYADWVFSKYGKPCSISLCHNSDILGICTVFNEHNNPDVTETININVTHSEVQGSCCWAIYESENFIGNYQVLYSNEKSKPIAFKEAKSIKSIPNCQVSPYECVDAPVCTIYNKENAPDPNNPFENLVECIRTIDLTTNDTNGNATITNDCKEKTNGVFEACHSISDSYHVCVPSEEEECDENDWIGKSCKGIGNIHTGKLSSFCINGKCEYGGIVIA